MLPTPARNQLTRPARWLTAAIILFVFLGLIYSALHYHHDFSAHPDCPICTLAGQATALTPLTEGPSPGQTPQPFFQKAPTRPADLSFSSLTCPRAPPA